jgi:steroid 5-alpha reductase family enzyme
LLHFLSKQEEFMPRNKIQRIVYGLIMSYVMAYGMEVYNVAIQMGALSSIGGFSSLKPAAFVVAGKEVVYMGAIVFAVSSLWGNRIGEKIAHKHVNQQTVHPLFYKLIRQGATVGVMCPTMSLIAAVIFNVYGAGAPITSLPSIWAGTVLKNFQVAFFWNIYAAAPLTGWLFGMLFKQVPSAALEQA